METLEVEFSRSELLSVRQVAEFLKLTPDSIRSFIKTGKLDAVKMGKVWRIHSSALNTFLEKRGLYLKEPGADSMIGTQRTAPSTAQPGDV
jgi:excisionase family DNA binding protein